MGDRYGYEELEDDHDPDLDEEVLADEYKTKADISPVEEEERMVHHVNEFGSAQFRE